jgi:hypothetical protein
MSGLHCLLYMSRATGEMAPADIDRLLEGARQRNRSRGVTGALLHYDGRFLQVLEGQAEAIDQCFGRIQTDRRHERITALYRAPIDAARFPEWSMRYVSSAGQADRAVSAFLDQLQTRPTEQSVKQAITLLHRLSAGSAHWQAR